MFALLFQLRWKGASHTRKKILEPFKILSKDAWLVHMSLPMSSSKQPILKGEMSSRSTFKHWKNIRLIWSYSSPTSEGKSLLTTNRTLRRLLCLLVLLPWRHLLHLKKNKCQVHARSKIIELHTSHSARVHCIPTVCLVIAIHCTYIHVGCFL